MDASINQQSSVTQQPGRFLAGLQALGIILNWIVGLMQMTEEEKEQAGIYIR